jgi:transposase-like protein
MEHDPIPNTDASTVCWENLEDFTRLKIQEFIQNMLEEEVNELLGRMRSQRKAVVDGSPGYRNGYGKPRKLSMASGTIWVQRPRVRDLGERFESRILPMFKKRTKAVGALIPELYLHGLSQGDFELALRGLLGEGAPLSSSSVARLKAQWQVEFEAWKRRPLQDLEVVYAWADGVYVKAGLEKEKAALLVIVAALRDGRKVVLAVEPGHRESTESWSAILRDLKQRGVACPRLFIGDGALGLWGAVANVFPEAEEQRCWNHRIVNVLDRVPKKAQDVARALLTKIPYAETRQGADNLKAGFQEWSKKRGFPEAGKLLDQDWERMVTFFKFPKAHWKHIRTTNVVESPFATVRLRTDAAKRFKKVENATAVIWKTLLVAEKTFRRLDAPELLAEVAAGVMFADGERVKRGELAAVA